MERVYTGPRHRAALLARMLRGAGFDAVMMFTEQPDAGSVFVPDRDAGSPAIQQAINQVEADGGAA